MTRNTNAPAPDPHARRRLTLLTSVAAIALVALGAVGAQLPALTANADAAPIAVAQQASSNPSSGFANLIASVRPAVVSVKVQLEQPVSMNSSGGGNALPFSPFGPFGMPGVPQMPRGNAARRRRGLRLLHLVRRLHRHRQPRGRPRHQGAGHHQ